MSGGCFQRARPSVDQVNAGDPRRDEGRRGIFTGNGENVGGEHFCRLDSLQYPSDQGRIVLNKSLDRTSLVPIRISMLCLVCCRLGEGETEAQEPGANPACEGRSQAGPGFARAPRFNPPSGHWHCLPSRELDANIPPRKQASQGPHRENQARQTEASALPWPPGAGGNRHKVLEP